MEKKKCTICKKDKKLSEYNKNKSKKDGLNNLCKTCSNERSKKYYADNYEHHNKVIAKRKLATVKENRLKIWEYFKTHPCVDCGEDDPIVLEFDHRDGVTKLGEIGIWIGRGNSWIKIKSEMNKCDVRCANCHKKRTAKQFNWYKYLNT